jgi:putative nucleotidyltransferase with HDIG domain
LEHVVAQLNVDAAAVLLLNPHTQMLEYSAGTGFRSHTIEKVRSRLGENHAGRAALDRRTIHAPDGDIPEGENVFSELLSGEGFVEYYGTPLIAKGQVKGVLEVYHRRHLYTDSEWLSFFETLAGQAAIAIDNAELFENLQRANLELTHAYDTTLEGWVRALDLRDKETQGHTQRVTNMTIQLSRVMGVDEVSLRYIRRGALLHDIGKMGIPDSILHKPGPLSDEEWEIMYKHPLYAYDLLSPIEYLRRSLDIPYCHHEKWDGTGYPRGLQGEQIPQAARIFAVVDVWDALCSDRPYRKRWERPRVLEYMHEQRGKHFNPEVVDAFLQLIQTDTEY